MCVGGGGGGVEGGGACMHACVGGGGGGACMHVCVFGRNKPEVSTMLACPHISSFHTMSVHTHSSTHTLTHTHTHTHSYLTYMGGARGMDFPSLLTTMR